MRKNRRTSNIHTTSTRGISKRIMKAVMFFVLFSLIFTTVLISAFSFDFANANSNANTETSQDTINPDESYATPSATITPSSASFNMSGTTFGDTHYLNNGSLSGMSYFSRYVTNNGNSDGGAYGTKHMLLYSNSSGGNFAQANTADSSIQSSDAPGNKDYFDTGNYWHDWTSSSYIPKVNGAGILQSYGCALSDVTYYLATYINIPAGVTSFTIDANMYSALCMIGYGPNVSEGMIVNLTADMLVYKGTISSVQSDNGIEYSSASQQHSHQFRTNSIEIPNGTIEFAPQHGTGGGMLTTSHSKTITRSDNEATSAQIYTIVLKVNVYKNNYWDSWLNNGSDYGQVYCILGNLRVTHKGYYDVVFNKNNDYGNVSGSMSNQRFHYGLSESTETLTPNGFTHNKSSATFLGWATSAGGSVVYQDRHNTSSRELTNVPGATVNLYAVWSVSDFSKLSSTSGLWGSENNPFVISDEEEWVNLIRIVNGTSNPNDSITGTYNGEQITTQASAGDKTYRGCYFVVINNLTLGAVDPVGYDSSHAFSGTIYGGDGVYSANKMLRTINANITVSGSKQAGLIGYLSGGNVEYIKVTGSVTNNGSGDGTGGIAGYVSGAVNIRNCESSATVNNTASGSEFQGTGGIVGTTNSSTTLNIENCVYSGTGGTESNPNITARKNIGGMLGNGVGSNTKVTISNCTAKSGYIYARADSVAGILGAVKWDGGRDVNLNILHCYNAATIKAAGSGGNAAAGGAIGCGYNDNSASGKFNVKYFVNVGDIDCNRPYVGGVAGQIGGRNTAVFEYCYNLGKVYGSSNTHLIDGSNNSTITNCWGLYTQGSDTASFLSANLNGSSSGMTQTNVKIAVLASSKVNKNDNTTNNALTAANAKTYFGLSDGSNNIYSLEDIAKSQYANVEFNKFVVFPRNNTELNRAITNRYISISAGEDRVEPDYSNNTPNDAHTELNIRDMIFSSSMAQSQLAIEIKDCSINNAPTTTFTYGNFTYRLSHFATATDYQNVTEVKLLFGEDKIIWHEIEVYDFSQSAYVQKITNPNVFYKNGVQKYDAKVAIYNGTHLMGNFCNTDNVLINQKELTVSSSWIDDYLISTDSSGVKKYIYRLGTVIQGLQTISVSGFIGEDNINTVLNVIASYGLSYNITNNNTRLETSTSNAGNYSITLTQKNYNYSFKVDGTVKSSPLVFAWEIQKLSISNPSTETVNMDTYNMFFGYGAGGVASGCDYFNQDYYALDMKSYGKLYVYSDTDAGNPYALVYNNGVNNNINSYNIFYRTRSGNFSTFNKLTYGTDFTITLNSGATLNGDTLTFAGNGNPVTVKMTLTGINNFEGTREIRFTLMDSDFGGNFNQPNYGSEQNPYLIAHEAHLIRLGQIVSGSPAWNSINSTNKSIAFALNENVYSEITERTYENGYFKVVTDNLTASTAHGFVSIGKSVLNGFQGAFDGNNHVIVLAINETNYEESYGWTPADFVGLFGYLREGAIIKDVSVSGSVFGRDYVGGIVGYAVYNTTFLGTIQSNANVTGRYYVGGIAGTLACSLDGAINGENATVSGEGAVGGIIGAITSSNNSVIQNCENRGFVKYRQYTENTSNSNRFNVTVSGNGHTIKINGIGGIVGFISSTEQINTQIVNCINYEKDTGSSQAVYAIDGAGANGVGGIVGFANVESGGLILDATTAELPATMQSRGSVRGASFVGGIIGYAYNVTITEYCTVNARRITGTEMYTGGVAGKWVVNDSAQIWNQRRVRTNILIEGNTYVGGLLGWLDARNATGIHLNPFISNGTDNPVRVIGTSYVGALYGGVEGYGYKRNSVNVSDDDTIIYVNPDAISSNRTYVEVTLKANGRVAGGLIGYVSGAGILFLGNWTGVNYTPITFEGTTSFFGGVIGVLGENASIESATNTDGGVSVGGVTHTVRYRDTQSNADINAKGDFVGSIVGYIASTAGAYFSADTTFMGNNIKLINNSQVKGRSFVGGIYGAIGKVADDHYTQINGVNESIFNDTCLMNLVRYGNFGAEATGKNTTLRYAPSDDGGLGKMINYQPIEGSADYVGGIVGYAGNNVLLALFNPEVTGKESGFSLTDVETYLNIFNGYGKNPTDNSTTTLKGVNYLGGIAGYLSGSAHELTRLVSLMLINGTGSYIGGLIGYMGGGTLANSMTTSGYNSPLTNVDAFRGTSYVGGLVGMLASGSITSSLSRGFNINSVDVTRGGVVGSVNTGTTVEASWTIYLATDPTYSTTSANKNGKFVIVDKTLIGSGSSVTSPSFSEYGRMVGLFTDTVSIIERASDKTYNPAKQGYVSLKTPIPSQNKQIVFYDASGNDKLMSGVFETLAGANDLVYYRFDMATMDNFSICINKITFKNIASNPSDNDEQKAFVRNAYVRPSADNFYDVDVQTASFVNGNIQSAGGVATCIGKNNQSNTNNVVVLGKFNLSFEIGDEATPYIISNQTDWNKFRNNVVGDGDSSVNGYAGKYVKLATDVVVVTKSNHAGYRDDSGNVFKGTFDGDGHKIRIEVESSSPSELFGMSVFPGASGATFKNLTIEGYIKATGDALNLHSTSTYTSDACNIAGFVGRPTGNLRFENCTSNVEIKAQRTAGGIVGFTNGYNIELVSCVNKGNIDCNDQSRGDYQNYDYGTGGIIGYANYDIAIESCKNEGNITGAYNVGGIIGQSNNATYIYNSANSGNILADAYWASEDDYRYNYGSGTYRFTYAGGVMGKVGADGSLTMLACYNSGDVTGYGIIQGGLVGSVGTFNLDNWYDYNTGDAKAPSLIAYCYNIGAIYSAGRTRNDTSGSSNEHNGAWQTGGITGWGREEMNGGVCGGIVGFIAWGDIKYCYNAGRITLFRYVSERWYWNTTNAYSQAQIRAGGIVGQAQPTGSRYVNLRYCYNIGEIFAYTSMGLDHLSDNKCYPCYGGGMVGYIDGDGNDGATGKVDTKTGCYTISNYLHVKNIKPGYQIEMWGSTSIFNRDGSEAFWSDYYRPGTSTLDGSDDGTPLTVEHFTAYMNSNGQLTVDRPIGGESIAENNSSAGTLIKGNGSSIAQFDGKNMHYDNAFTSANAYGYIYVYGCLPQLAVFALDTKEGLSMLSVSYGRNDYGEFVGNQAGSKESPYVIKDGVGLLAMSSLNNSKSTTGGGTAYYNFKDKYIEFADGTNNIEGLASRYINMDMTGSNSMMSGSSENNYDRSGKNYFLWRDGAVSGNSTLVYGSTNTSSQRTTIRNNWVGKNYYFNGANSLTGNDFSNYANFYPIGGINRAFEGNISGLQSDGNTEIRNLHISYKPGEGNKNPRVGLFGAVLDGSVSYITVCGSICVYSAGNSPDYRTFAGGITGYAGCDTSIIGCQAGSANAPLEVSAYADTNSVASPAVSGYAGGIVGAVGAPRVAGNPQSHMTIEISDCISANVQVSAPKSNAGGIVGFVGNPWNANDTSTGNTVTINNVYVYNSSVQTREGVTSSDAGINIGGIVGTNDGKINFIINGAYVGVAPEGVSANARKDVTISGENSVGGVIGTANGRVEIRNVNVAQPVTISRVARGTAENVAGDTLYRTAIGGVIGRTVTAETIDVTNTLRDSIKFGGTINIAVANTNPSDSNPTGNIGGVIGAMGAGTRFLSGSDVEVTGTITIANTLDANKHVRNIGGVVGATIEGAFDGTFTVEPTITAINATNVGGFIGRNFGTTNILASASGTNITINANITGRSQVGGLVGINGYVYSDANIAGSLVLGADTYAGGRYEGELNITIADGATISASDADGQVGGLIGSNIATSTASETRGLIITKGTIYNKGTVNGVSNVGGIIGYNSGDISMGGSTLVSATLTVVNEGNVNGSTSGSNVGGVIGYLQQGSIAGTFANTGSVVGGTFVGGSIGRLDKDAVITVSGSINTEFRNGSIGTEQSDEALSTDAQSVGNVTGKMYVGGSIGAMFGNINGSAEYYVAFVNDGEVNGETFMGGNIGLLAGGVSNAQFTNSGQVNASGAVAIGGSVGFIGIPTAYDTTSYDHQTISVSNAHFEFVANDENGANGISVTGSAPAGKGELEWGGVGGAIGVIGNATDGFNNQNGNLWQNVTLYSEGSISAEGINNVGGAIGLIKADNIAIDNMLAFYTTVSGAKNVGGIVGAVTGNNIRINNSFNIEGTVTGNTAGGIVGLANTTGAGATVADTSYWVKGYVNAQLMALNLSDVVSELGKWEAVVDGDTVFTEELTTAYGTPADYTGKESDGKDWATYLRKFSKNNKPVSINNGVWAYALDSSENATGYSTGTANTGWYYLYANDRPGLDATHVNADNPTRPSVLSSTTRAGELKYWKRIANAYTAEEIRDGEDKTPLTSNITVNKNGNNISGGGTVNQGHIYAMALSSTIDGYYLYMDSTSENKKPEIYYSSSEIDWIGIESIENLTGKQRPFYLDAQTSLDGGFNVQNVAVYYRSVDIGGTLTYNGYERYVPITGEIDKDTNLHIVHVPKNENLTNDVSKAGTYVYKVGKIVKDGAELANGVICEAGNYEVDVDIYFYDTLGNYGKIGGIAGGALRIDEMTLKVTYPTTTVGGTYNGEATSGEIKLTFAGIAPLDNGVNTLNNDKRSVKFIVNGKETQISGVINLGTLMQVGNLDSISASDASNYVNLNTTKIYLSKIEVSKVADKDLNTADGIKWDTSCVLADTTETPYQIALTFKFSETVKDTLSIELEKTGISKSYKTVPSPIEVDFNIKPKELVFKIADAYENDASKKGCDYDGATHDTYYLFEGWAEKSNENRTGIINGLKPYLQFNPHEGNPIGSDSALWDLANSTYALKQNNITYMTAEWVQGATAISLKGMKDNGEYYVKFATEATYDVNGKLHMLTADGNYYITLPENPEYLYTIKPNTLTVAWSKDCDSNPSLADYNAKYHYLYATFTADKEFSSAELLKEEVMYLFESGYTQYAPEAVDGGTNKAVKIQFRVGPNAGKYDVEITKGATANCILGDENRPITNGTYTINKLKLEVSFEGSDSRVYNGAYHQVPTINITCENGDANPAFTFNQTDGKYTLSMFENFADKKNTDDENKVVITLLYVYNKDGEKTETAYAVNVGEYTAKVGTVTPFKTGVNNFEVEANANGTLSIETATVMLAWDTTQTRFTYDGQTHGLKLRLSSDPTGLTKNSFSHSPSEQSPTSAIIVLTNKNGNSETITVPISGNGQKDAGTYTSTVNKANITVSGKNVAGDTSLNNYTFITPSGTSYTIDPLTISVTGINGGRTSKVYDATVNVPSSNLGTPTFSGSLRPASTSLTVTAKYNSANVGSRKITYTITIKAGTKDAQNFNFTNGTDSITRDVNGTITARPLTVTLDMLRNNRATRSYNGNVYYGGANGARSKAGEATAKSAIYRNGEGFTVSGIAVGEISTDAVIITAMFREAFDGRSDFDGYVNNVVGTGKDLSIGTSKYGEDGYFYKNLVFVLSGTSASNYTFKVVKQGSTASIGNTDSGTAGDSGAVTVGREKSDIIIEITSITATASYINTAQSYATPDNKYNTSWEEVGLRNNITGMGGDLLGVEFINNWMFENNNPTTAIPREYHAYTVIRGSENSNVLSAKLTSNNGVHVNYRLGNQPILTIGYFVDKEEFSVGSIASLMIASYYYTASKNGGGDFGIVGQAKWQFVVSEEDYFANRNVPTDKFVNDAGEEVTFTTWDEYFDWLATNAGGNREIVFNLTETPNGYGYYFVDDSDTTPVSFDKFKQTANISGVLTAGDIAILDGMFKRYDNNGNLTSDWGVGSKYLDNFLKLRAGSVATAMGSVFVGMFDGAYDGNGYVIDSLNVIGVANGTDNYYGMFAQIAEIAQVKNVHLRNLSITVNGAGTVYVGGLAGESAQKTSIENVSVHATVNVNASTANVGGLFGATTSAIDGVIVLGDMTVNATNAHIGGAVGNATGSTVKNVVSLMQIWANAGSVGGILGSASTSTLGGVNVFMQNSVYKNKSAISGGVSYAMLFNGSKSGYASGSEYYYFGEEGNRGSTYDVLDDIKLSGLDGDEQSRTNPRESMRLRDIIDIYMLMYSKSETSVAHGSVNVAVFTISADSWLVGRAHGTSDSDAIEIANQQGIALMRELRFATFKVTAKVNMYSTYKLQTASGAFYGTVKANEGCGIYIATWNGTQTMFEVELGTATPTSVLHKA